MRIESNLKIRAEKPSDYEAIAAVNTLAFGRKDEARLVEKIRASKGYLPQLSLIAELENIIVGHICFSYVDLVGTEIQPILALAPMAVRPDFQKQGIGSKLVRVGLEEAIAIAAPLVVVLGHSLFYSRFGFEPSVNYRIEPPFPVPKEVFMVKPLKNYQKHYRGKVVYPPAFNDVC